MREPDELIAAVESEIGIDAYHLYPDSRRLIPDTVLWALASACVVEFIKGFIDLNGIGKIAREKCFELGKRFRERDQFEQFSAHESANLKQSVELAIKAIPPSISEADIALGQRAVERALGEFGLKPHQARERAEAIARYFRAE